AWGSGLAGQPRGGGNLFGKAGPQAQVGPLFEKMVLPSHPEAAAPEGAPPKHIAALGPDRMRFAVRLPPDVAPAPTAPARIAIAVESIVRKAEKGRRVSFHNELELRIELTQRAFGADVGFQPFVGDRDAIGARAIPVILVSTNAGPGSGSIFAAVGAARFDDVMQPREFTANPRAGVVLV